MQHAQSSQPQAAVSSADRWTAVAAALQFPSPYEAAFKAAEADDEGDSSTNPSGPLNPLNEEPFVAPVPVGNPTVTVGMAIIRPMNALYGPAMNNTHGAVPTNNKDYIDHSNLDTSEIPSNKGAPVNGKNQVPASKNQPKDKPLQSTPPPNGPTPQLAPKAPVIQPAWRAAAMNPTSTAPVQASPSPSPAGLKESGPSAGAKVYGMLEQLGAGQKQAGHPLGRRLLSGL